MITSPYFLQYMNDALSLYKDIEEVISIHGYSYPVKRTLPDTFFLRGADCWGWATWKRGWKLFNLDSSDLYQQLQVNQQCYTFDFEGTHSYCKMLKNNIQGKNDSWAIRWYASAFLRNKLTLYPGRSLIHNIGNDGSGSHSLS